MYYTSVNRLGNKLCHRYIKDGKRYSEIVEGFEYELFVQSNYSNDSVDVYNNPLKRYTFSDISELTDFIKNTGPHNIYGNTDPVAQFIAKTYPDTIQLKNDYVVLNFDIETEHATGIPRYPRNHPVLILYVETGIKEKRNLDELKSINAEIKLYDEEKEEWLSFEDTCYAPKSLGFPDPNMATCEVLSVALTTVVDKESNNKVIYVIGTKDYSGETEIENTGYKIHYTKARSEKELLALFIQKWREIKPDIITGWNIEGFDIPYMINRITRVLGHKFTNMLSPFSNESQSCIKERQKDDSVYYSIVGITIYDYLPIYKKFSRSKQESYKLDWIGQVEVDHAKVSYSEYNDSLMLLWELDYNKFVYYNAVDTLIVNKIDNKLKYINLAITIAHITKSDLSEAMGTIKIWDSLIYKMLGDKNIQLIPQTRKEKTKPFIGAAVKEPIFGRSGWTVTYDLTSLYPSIIRMLEMSPETIVDREVGYDCSANYDKIYQINSNIEIVQEILDRKKHGNNPFNVDNIDMLSDFDDIDLINILENTYKSNLVELIDKLNSLKKYYSSGHQYLLGVDSVLENVDNLIEMKTDLSYAKERNVTIAGNGSSYAKNVNGVIPSAMTMLFEYRKQLKNEMKENKKLLQKKIEELHKLEKAIEI